MKKKDKRLTEAQIYAHLSEYFDLTQKQIRDLFHEYEEIAIAQINKFGSFPLSANNDETPANGEIRVELGA